MDCVRCKVPLDTGESQCSVCGEIQPRPQTAKPRGADTATSHPSDFSGIDDRGDRVPLDFLYTTPTLSKPAIIWMVGCAVIAGLFIAVAWQHFSIELMWASVVACALIFVPLLFIVFGRLLQLATVFRRGLTWILLAAAAVAIAYYIGSGIKDSNVQVDATGAVDMMKDGNFTKTAITFIICCAALAALYPLAKVLHKALQSTGGTRHYQAETSRELGLKANENETTVKIKSLEMEREIALLKLEIEQERVKLEHLRVTMLPEYNDTKRLTHNDWPAAAGTPPPPPPLPPTQPPA